MKGMGALARRHLQTENEGTTAGLDCSASASSNKSADIFSGLFSKAEIACH
jgi:hypothetical protein